ncbi:serpin B5 [Anabrus simplex]|uniref:serpin B5 n=1 Tax=Anabrus simplex TaxID=316456 RepID=UPI0035A3407D
MLPAARVAVLLAVVVVVTSHDHPIHELAAGQLSFSTKLYEILSEREGNLVFSPATLQTLLGMLYLTAAGKNAEQLARNIGLPHHAEDAPRAFREMLRNILNANEYASTYIFNDIFVSSPFNISDDLRNTVSKNFLGNIQQVDITKDSEGIKEKLNAQLEKLGQKKFKSFVQPDFIAKDNILAVSGLYVAGDWTENLVRRTVSTHPFYVSKIDSKEIYMLTGTGALRTTTLAVPRGTRVLELPYKENELLLTVLLPAEKDGLRELERHLKDINIRKMKRSLEDRNVKVTLPLVEELSQISFKEPLIKLGLVDMFDEKASSFPGLIDAPLQLSDIIQETYVIFTSNGTKIASALGPRAAEETLEFTIDHPFFFIIEEPKTETLVAIGRFTTP